MRIELCGKSTLVTLVSAVRELIQEGCVGGVCGRGYVGGGMWHPLLQDR
jgi:hypothetical protein